MTAMTVDQLVALLRQHPGDTEVCLYLDHDPAVPDGIVPVHGLDTYAQARGFGGKRTIVLVGDYPEVASR